MKYTETKYNIAGIAAARIISVYPIPVISAMRNAPAPITGGSIWPPADAVASTAAANLGLYPVFLINGIVRGPVVTTLPAEVPLIVPIEQMRRLILLPDHHAST